MTLTALTRAVGTATLRMKQTSPTLMFAVGVGAVVGGTILACRATLKVEDVLDNVHNQLDDVNKIEHSDYSDQEKLRDRSLIYLDATMELTKLYGPAVIVGGVGIALLTGSHVVLTRRNAALTAAYAALEKSYSLYREKVREAIGEDDERHLHYDVSRTLAEKEKSEEQVLKGKKKKPLKKGYSEYAKFFDDLSPNWCRNPEKNLHFIHMQQDWANQALRNRGHVFLNEVYDMLGIPRTEAGAVVGWVWMGDGDNYIDFGVFNHHTDEVRAFVNGVENSILLDFNVDGLIYDKIEKR